jgi:hypothetical protein
MLVFFVIVGDPVAFWEAELGSAAEIWRNLGAVELADSLTEGQAILAAQMTMFIVTLLWTIYAATLVLGYKLFRQLPDETDRYGRFRDLNFGRVIALIMALCSVVALLSGAAWLQNVAFVMFAVFGHRALVARQGDPARVCSCNGLRADAAVECGHRCRTGGTGIHRCLAAAQ